MKGFHKRGDKVLISATITRVDEGNIEEELDPVTFEGTGKFRGQALLDVDIPGLGVYTIAANAATNGDASARQTAERAKLEALVAAQEEVHAPKPSTDPSEPLPASATEGNDVPAVENTTENSAVAGTVAGKKGKKQVDI